jgi:hypothetical protein
MNTVPVYLHHHRHSTIDLARSMLKFQLCATLLHTLGRVSN